MVHQENGINLRSLLGMLESRKRLLKENGSYCADDRRYVPLSAFPVGYHRAELCVFMAKFHGDKPLVGNYDIPQWIMLIQVGVALTGMCVADVVDCDGEIFQRKIGIIPN